MTLLFDTFRLIKRKFPIDKGLGISISSIKNKPFSYIKTPVIRKGYSDRRKGKKATEETRQQRKQGKKNDYLHLEVLTLIGREELPLFILK